MDYAETGHALDALEEARAITTHAADLVRELIDGRYSDSAAWKAWAEQNITHAVACLNLAKKWLEEVDA